MDEPISFGAWLKRRRKALDLTQNELADQIGCSLSTIVKIEADERRPSRQIAGLLASILQIPPDQQAAFIKMARGERRLERMPLLPDAQSALSPAASRLSTGIPAPRNQLVGREAERREIMRLILDPACRLLTLTGPGGIGKTRLAKEVGTALAGSPGSPFPDGLYWVPLASVHSASYLVPAIAQALGEVVASSTDLRLQVASTLRDRQVLLLLDNLEHLLDGVYMLSELLQEAPGLKLLATSQVRLNLSGEWVFDIQGLPFPQFEEEHQLDQYGAVRLFLNYASQTRSNFQPGADEYRTIAQICRLLEGLPLAIQLAAAWARVLSPQEILRELEKTTQAGEFPDFLTNPSRDIPERHRSLQAAFDYSWRLLDEHERIALSRLSVFEGGFRREAAEQVAGLSLSELAGLMDKSLVLRIDPGRYSLHDLVHKYSFVRLKEDPEEMRATLEKHCLYYGGLLQPYVYRLKGRTQLDLQAIVAADINNFRQAWDWATKNKRTREIQLLSQGFTWFYELRGWYMEGLDVFSQAIAALSSLESAPENLKSEERQSLAAVLIGYGWFLNRHGRNSSAKEYFLRGLSLLRSGESPESLANVLRFIGMLDLQVGEYAEGRAYVEESLRISQPVNYTYGLALCYSHLGMIDYAQGRLQEALHDFRVALEFWDDVQEPIGTSYCLRYLRQVALMIDASSAEYLEACEKILDTLAISRASDDAWGTGTTLNHLGVLDTLQDELSSAAAYFREAAGLFRRIGDPYSLSQSYIYLGSVLARQGDIAEAHHAYVRGFESAREAESYPYMLESLLGLARLSQATADLDVLWVLANLAIEHPATMFETRVSATELRQLLVERVSDGVVAATQVNRAVLTLEQIAQHLSQSGGSG